MTNTDGMQQLIDELSAALSEYDRLKFDEEDVHELGAPASSEQITSLQSTLGRPVPPSYRSFLELHNGWSDFAGGAKILAVEDHGSEWVRQRMDEWSELVEAADDPFAKGAIPVLLGTHESSFLAMDPTSARPDGEMDYVMYDYMHEEKRFKDFQGFLEHRLKILRMLIDREKHGAADDMAEDNAE